MPESLQPAESPSPSTPKVSVLGANRKTRRAWDSACRRVNRGTKVPPSLSATLAIQIPGALKDYAARRGREITAAGYVRPMPRQAGIAIPA